MGRKLFKVLLLLCDENTGDTLVTVSGSSAILDNCLVPSRTLPVHSNGCHAHIWKTYSLFLIFSSFLNLLKYSTSHCFSYDFIVVWSVFLFLHLPDPCFGISLHFIPSYFLHLPLCTSFSLLTVWFSSLLLLKSFFSYCLIYFSTALSVLSLWQKAKQQQDRLYLARHSFTECTHTYTYTHSSLLKHTLSKIMALLACYSTE